MSSPDADRDQATDVPAIGARLRRFRNERGLSLTELAELSGVSKSHLSTIENGTGSRPGAAVLHKLATTLGVTLADVLGRRVLPNSDLTIPDSLRDFAREQGLPEADVHMLAAIKFRGEQPKTTQRWGFIYNAIKNSAGMDSQR